MKFQRRKREVSEKLRLRYRVVLLQHANNVPLDIALGALPFEAGTVERSSLWEADSECFLRTCDAEDLVVHKAFAGRPQDWLDVEGILARQRGRLDHARIFAELRPLAELKEDSAIMTRLENLLSR